MSKNVDPSLTLKPRTGKYSEFPGKYVPVVRFEKQIIDRGNQLNLEMFFSGYGNILAAKLYFNPSKDVFIKDKCTLYAGMSAVPDENGGVLIQFTNRPMKIDEKGGTVYLNDGGITVENWGDGPEFIFDTAFGDKYNSAPQISTECVWSDKAPLRFELLTKEKVRPGLYTLQFVLTYYDGVSWQVSNINETFKIRNILDKYQVSITVVGFIAAGVTILAAIKQIFCG